MREAPEKERHKARSYAPYVSSAPFAGLAKGGSCFTPALLFFFLCSHGLP